jgi:benzoyl-CoA 2,3-dioxygenase component A
VLQALQDIAVGAGMDWSSLAATLKQEGRLQLETY